MGDDAPADDPVGALFQSQCTVSGLTLTESLVAVLSVQGVAESDGTGYIVLRTQYSPDQSSDVPELPPLASDGPVAPATGDQLAPDQKPRMDEPPLLVVEGSEPITDPLPSGCTTGGYVAVLQVTGELMPVMRGYLEQFTRRTAFTSEGVVGDEDEPRVFAEATGGGSLTALGVAGDPSYVLIDNCDG